MRAVERPIVRVLLADDQASFRTGLRDALSTVEAVAVIGEASNGSEAVRMAALLQPDAVLMDLRMPGMDGIAATRAICSERPGSCVLVLTTFDEDELVTAAIRAGALGYLLKGTPVDDIANILRLALRGYTAIGPGVRPNAPIAADDEGIDAILARSNGFSDREREVWSLIGEGLTNREVAKQLFLSEGTVKNYVSAILGSLGVRHRTQAALLWRRTRKPHDRPQP